MTNGHKLDDSASETITSIHTDGQESSDNLAENESKEEKLKADMEIFEKQLLYSMIMKSDESADITTYDKKRRNTTTPTSVTSDIRLGSLQGETLT